jgi:hypothetical protein
MMMGIIIIILVTQCSAKSIVFSSTANRHPFYLCYFTRCLCLIIVYFNLIDLDINVILHYSIYVSTEKEVNLVIVFLLAVTSSSSGRYWWSQKRFIKIKLSYKFACAIKLLKTFIILIDNLNIACNIGSYIKYTIELSIAAANRIPFCYELPSIIKL